MQYRVSLVLLVSLALSFAAQGQPGPAVGWGDNFFGQASPPPGEFLQIASGNEHSTGIRPDGTVATWGRILDVPTGTFRFVESCDGIQPFSVGIRTDGSLASWGAPVQGALDLPQGAFVSLALGVNHGVGIRADGTLAGWGRNTFGQANPPSGAFLSVAAIDNVSFGVRADGTLAAWGLDFMGLLGVPQGQFTSVAAGTQFALALRTDGTLVAWGSNSLGQLNVPSGTFRAISAGMATGYALRTDGTLAAWGANNVGQANVPSGTFGAISANGGHAIAIVPTPGAGLVVALGLVAAGRRGGRNGSTSGNRCRAWRSVSGLRQFFP